MARPALVEAYGAADVLFLHLGVQPAFEKVLPSKIFEYAAQKIAERRKSPGDDLITKLTRAEVGGRPLTDPEIVGMVSLILIGGMDTVVTAMSFAALFLAVGRAAVVLARRPAAEALR